MVEGWLRRGREEREGGRARNTVRVSGCARTTDEGGGLTWLTLTTIRVCMYTQPTE
jgi:hypothetical protein